MKKFFQKSNPYLSDPDVQRMLEVKRGSKVAFEALMRQYYPRILNFIYRFVGHKSTAEDLAQEVFMRVYKNAGKYKPKSKFQTWIYTIARNVALNELRSGSRFAYSLDTPAGGGDAHTNKEMADIKLAAPDEEIIQREKADLIRAAISQLPENQKSAVLSKKENLMTISQKDLRSYQ